MLVTMEQLWFKMVEYKLCFGKTFEIKYDYNNNTWMYMDLIKFLNENIYPLLDEDSNYVVENRGKNYREIIQDFVKKNSLAKDFYPEILSQIEEYYFGITEPFFTCEEVFWIEYLEYNAKRNSIMGKTKVLAEEFIEQIDEAIMLNKMNGIDLLVYAA